MPQRQHRWKEEIAFVSTPATTILTRLLPDATTLRLHACAVDDATAQITLRVRSTQTSVPCPRCAVPSQRIHSHYARTLADLPWAQYRVCLQLRVRKWFCRNRSCPRRIFTERLPTVAAPWARRTLRLAQRLVALGLALGGTAGVRLSHAWDLLVSRNTLLRGLRRQPAPSFPTPRVLGVDDFALRKRHTYGTILVDLERQAARGPAPGAHRRARGAVAPGASRGGGDCPGSGERVCRRRPPRRPAATQVVDRFHLIQNLAEALDAVFTTHHQALAAVNTAMRQQPVPLPDGTLAVPVPPPPTPPAEQARAAQGAARRQARYDAVWALHRQGWSTAAIAAQVGCSRRTIERYLQMPTWPDPQHRRHYGRSIVNPYKAYLLERWNAGCHTAIQLFQELQARGYTGSYRRVTAYVSRIRQAQGIPPRRQGRRQSLPVVAEPVAQPLTPRRAAWLVLRREAKCTAAETQQLAQLHAQSAEVAEAIDLAQDFTGLVRQRQPERLEPWLMRATASTWRRSNALRAGSARTRQSKPV